MVIKNEQILNAAASVLAHRPDATLQSIAKAAGISRTTIFNKYPTRDALLEALAIDTLERIGAAMAKVPSNTDSDPIQVLTEVTQMLMQLGPRTAFMHVVPGWGNDVESHWAQAATPLAIYIAQLQGQGYLRGDQPVRWLTASYIGLLFTAWDEISAGELGINQAATLIVESWLSGSSR